ncbi:hypothetical protein [Neochlamydia sp. AcF95]|uniref:hypothetical protein n=1 Tax=Neochlamydia sp. AcF95 TaxID=2795734 RepID=UPI001BC98DFC|nr:hypothetical protein [Neochlamydia sp. AcF95]MBS4170989.1 Uncharacterized protein [Neochlamydia sp. AcF95]
MLNSLNPFEDPFLIQKLNPLLIESLHSYWIALKEAKVSAEEKLQVEDALYNLVGFAFLHLFQPLYHQHPPKISGSVFLLSAVHSDGIGDYITLFKCAKILKEHHPALEVYLAYTHKQSLPSIDPYLYHIKKENIYAFKETEEACSVILEPILEGKKSFLCEAQLDQLLLEHDRLLAEYEALQETHPQIALAIQELSNEVDRSIQSHYYYQQKKVEAEKLYLLMKKSLAIVHIALALNTFDNPELASKSLYFAEAGNFQGIANYLQRHWFSIGLNAFEEGVFLNNHHTTSHWSCTALCQYLWQVDQPLAEHLENYLKDYAIEVAYLPHSSAHQEVFIEMMCRFHLHDSRHLTIILPQHKKEQLLHFSDSWMLAYGFSKILVVDFVPSARETVLNQINLAKRKILRLVYVLPLPASDFTKLINLSGEIIGCTGDGSLSDCIQSGKIPFYEVRRHKTGTLEAFIQLAQKLMLPEVLKYCELLKQFADWPVPSFLEKFEAILQDSSFRKQWKTLVEFIKHYYCLEDSYLALINRFLWMSLSKEVKEKEKSLINSYFEGTIGAESVYLSLEETLKSQLPKIVES